MSPSFFFCCALFFNLYTIFLPVNSCYYIIFPPFYLFWLVVKAQSWLCFSFQFYLSQTLESWVHFHLLWPIMYLGLFLSFCFILAWVFLFFSIFKTFLFWWLYLFFLCLALKVYTNSIVCKANNIFPLCLTITGS